jgi:hypothetical protein
MTKSSTIWAVLNIFAVLFIIGGFVSGERLAFVSAHIFLAAGFVVLALDK